MSDEQKKKTETMSFRLDGSVLDKIRAESESQGVSLNVLANKIFSRYVDWDMFEPKVGMIPVAKPIVSALFEKLSEEETVELARQIGQSIVSDISTFMKGTMDIDSFVSWFVTRMKISDFEMNHTINGSKHSYIIKHDLGYNWSLYHKTVLELIFNNVLEKKIDFQIKDMMMELSFEK
ncbi:MULTISPECIES: hypothetical protein [Nitrosopumilus]|uniref:Uncharacterized protein n=1 Tax=Nitrosopumilus adriaticus TaxID=1580092 RepID=A0A0D5C0D9_9ARCH|nr:MULTISPECIES: hypothetical protein [Nitrosopumilus]AJW70274.1 hypothetical protein NADRNF5_0578 [Nitrosopumilus adriaticus]KAF6246495.1 hypothetical protein C6990_08290 [Nitrosopumilus sp. b3]NNL58519.1 hypothetical protein [Nitrosopumilus sp.]